MKPLSLSRPHIIVMVGIPGSGKSFFGDHFAETFKVPTINVKKLQSDMFGDTSTDAYHVDAAQNAGMHMLHELLKTGQTVVFEGDAATKQVRRELAKIAYDAGYGTLFVWVQTESYEAGRRSMSKSAKPRLSKEEFNEKVKAFVIPDASEKAVVISGKHTYASQLKIVLKHLASDRGDVHKIHRRTINPISRTKHIR